MVRQARVINREGGPTRQTNLIMKSKKINRHGPRKRRLLRVG